MREETLQTTEHEHLAAMVCYRHPERETSLRCNQCERPICPGCAVHTPTGYRCKECIRGQQKVFDTSQSMDYVWAVAISGVVAFLGSLLVSAIGYFSIFAAPLVGMALAGMVRFATGKRRSAALFKVVVITSVAASLPLLLWTVVTFILSLGAGAQAFFLLLKPVWMVYYVITMTGTAYYRLSGKNLRWRK